MQDLFRQCAVRGRTPRDALLAKCHGETTTKNDTPNGLVNILVGFAPTKPAEFVIIRMQQGQDRFLCVRQPDNLAVRLLA
jgi:hypothetical protein